MFYELYTKRMSAEAAKEIAKAKYEKVKNEYELGNGHLSNEDDKNLREWIYGGIHEGAEIIKIITDFLPAGKATKVLKTIKESWNNKAIIRKVQQLKQQNNVLFYKKSIEQAVSAQSEEWVESACVYRRKIQICRSRMRTLLRMS